MTGVLFSLGIMAAAFGVDVAQVQSTGEQVWTIVDAVHRHHVSAPERLALWNAIVPSVCSKHELAERRKLAEEFNRTLSASEFGEILVKRFEAGKRSDIAADALVESVLQSLEGELGPMQLTRAKDYAVDEQLRNNRYVGFGVTLGRGTDDGYPQFHEILPGGTAERSGLEAGVTILEVDGKSVQRVSVEELLDVLRGPLGSEVRLKIAAGQGHPEREITLTRGVVRRDSILNYLGRPVGQGQLSHASNPAIGWLNISEISASTLHELRCVDRMVRQTKIRAIVIDFSNNRRAGDFHQAKLVADGLLSGSLIWTRHDRDSQPRSEMADGDCLFPNMPLVIMVSQRTTSDKAAIAAALQDAGRAVIVGESPPFDGSVVTAVPISANQVLQLRTFRISRARTEKSWPLIPDVIPKSLQPTNVTYDVRRAAWQLIRPHAETVPQASVEREMTTIDPGLVSALFPANVRQREPAPPRRLRSDWHDDSVTVALKVAQERISESLSAESNE